MKRKTKPCVGQKEDDLTVSATFAKEKSLKEITEDVKHDKSIGIYTLIAVTVYLEFFWTLKDYLKALVQNIPWLDGVLSTVVVFLIGSVSASGVYYAIYHFVRRRQLVKWAKENARMWVNGDWIHLHIKDVVRIGYLHIDQDFEKLHVYGYNTDPAPANQSPAGRKNTVALTTWKYEVGRVSKSFSRASKEDAYEYYGSYCAERKVPLDDVKKVKYGVHRMEIIPSDREDKLPVRLEGYFGDTAKSAAHDEIEQHYGNLYFFRMSGALSRKLKEFSLPEQRLEYLKEQFNEENTVYPEIKTLRNAVNDYRRNA